LIDFPDSIPYSPIEAALPDRARHASTIGQEFEESGFGLLMIKRNVTIELEKGKNVPIEEIKDYNYQLKMNGLTTLDIATDNYGNFHFEAEWDNKEELNKIIGFNQIISPFLKTIAIKDTDPIG
jgi:hypothetical protein